MKYSGLKVEWYDHPLRFMVESEAGEEDYLVQLDAYDGNGKCNCMHFTTRIEPYLSRDEEPHVVARCKHIKAAREFLTDQIVNGLTGK